MKKRAKLVAIILSIFIISLTSTFISAATATESNFDYYGVGDYWWYNYDFLDDEDAEYDNVDWPITMFFYGAGASVDDAKDLLWYWSSFTSMYSTYYDCEDEEWDWSSDVGTKTNLLDLDAWHARLYAEDDYRTPDDGCIYYVLGTTHRDYLWATGGYGWSDDAADVAMDKAAETVGEENVDEQLAYFYNYEAPRWEGNHYWQHDGWARGVYME